MDLHVVAWNLFFVAMGVHSPPHSAGKASQAVSPTDSVDGCIRGLDLMVALEVPDDADWPHVVGTAQVKDPIYDFLRILVWVVMANRPAADQSLLPEFSVSTSPDVEGRSGDSEVAAGLSDVPDLLCTLKNSLLSSNFPLLVGHSDPLCRCQSRSRQSGPAGSEVSHLPPSIWTSYLGPGQPAR